MNVSFFLPSMQRVSGCVAELGSYITLSTMVKLASACWHTSFSNLRKNVFTQKLHEDKGCKYRK